MEAAVGPIERRASHELDKYTLDDPNILDAMFFDAGGDPGRDLTPEELGTTVLNLVMGCRSAIVLLARKLDDLGPGDGGNLEADPPVPDD